MKRVPATGPRDASIMICGEGPGKDELREGEPFVGKSGEMLNRILSTEGIRREDCFITNATKTKKKRFFRGSNPTDWFQAGIDELREEIQEVDPEVIIAVGKQAMYATTSLRRSITKYRGSPLPCVHSRAWVIPILHPAYIMRGQWHKKPLLFWDIRKAKRIAEEDGPRRPDRDFNIFPSEAEVRAAIERFTSVDEFVADTEWYSPDILSCIGFSDDPEYAICIPADHPSADEAYRAILQSNAVKIFQNAMFDVPILARKGIKTKIRDGTRRLVEDTMVAFFYCWPDLGTKKLHDIVSVYTDEEYYKDDLEFSKQTGNLELEYEYNCKDNAYTYECWEKLQEEFEWMGTRQSYENSMMNFDIMCQSAIDGIRIDEEKFHELRDKDIRERDMQQEFLDGLFGMPFNVKAHKKMKHIIYNVFNAKVPRGARRNTRQETLMDIAFNTDDENLKKLLLIIVAVRHRRTRLERYYNPDNIDPDGRMRFSWDLCGTKNGRYSAKKTWWGSGVPIQQIPYVARQIFVPDPGHVFLMPDLEQAEARVVAYLTEDDTLFSWIEDNRDIHAMLGNRMFGTDYEVLADKSGHERGEHPQRYIAKRCRHALNYRMGASRFRFTVNKDSAETGIGVSQQEANLYRKRYLQIHPNLQLWWKSVEKQLRDTQSITNAFGRKRVFYQSWGKDLVNDAIACYPQGTIADLCHHGLRRVADELPYVKIYVNMHDGALIQCPEDRAKEAAAQIPELMTIPLIVKGHKITIPVEMKTGMSWGG